jgi:hypothetical protein
MLKHIAIGMFMPFCIFLFVYAKNGFRVKSKELVKVPPLLLLCGIWSIMPNILDKLHLWPLNIIANNFFISNIFFFHGVLKRLHTSGASWGLGLIFIVFFLLSFIFIRHLKIEEEKLKAYDKGKL